ATTSTSCSPSASRASRRTAWCISSCSNSSFPSSGLRRPRSTARMRGPMEMWLPQSPVAGFPPIPCTACGPSTSTSTLPPAPFSSPGSSTRWRSMKALVASSRRRTSPSKMQRATSSPSPASRRSMASCGPAHLSRRTRVTQEQQALTEREGRP
ncbi:unnamed protein product, partial [Effrenium voratum]